MTDQPELPFDPEYVAACDEVQDAWHALQAAHAAWHAACKRRNAFLIADGVLPADE